MSAAHQGTEDREKAGESLQTDGHPFLTVPSMTLGGGVGEGGIPACTAPAAPGWTSSSPPRDMETFLCLPLCWAICLHPDSATLYPGDHGKVTSHLLSGRWGDQSNLTDGLSQSQCRENNRGHPICLSFQPPLPGLPLGGSNRPPSSPSLASSAATDYPPEEAGCPVRDPP